MSKVALRWLIASMGLSLVGLVIFQVYWIGSIISANEEAFEREALDALNAVANKLEKKEALVVAVDNFHTNMVFKSPSGLDSTKFELIESTFEKKVVEVKDFARDSLADKGWLSFYFTSEKEDPQIKDVRIELKELGTSGARAKLLISTGKEDSILPHRQEYEKRLKRVAKKTEYIQLAMHELFSNSKPLESRINFAEADSLLKASLLDRGIDLPYKFGIFEPMSDVYISEGKKHPKIESYKLKASLFPNDVMGEAGYLFVKFPDQRTYLMGKIWLTLASSILFIFIILLCFSYAIRTIYKQKQLSEIKNDFINNMTHEFKTPISTVSLACEALRDNQISATEGLKDRYLAIIHDENKRLGLQVEKVLQMAVIERKDFELKLELVNVHEIIEKAMGNIAIQVSKKGGNISKDLKALKQTVKADQMHLTNIVYNLLDNANKYSMDQPEIKITTIDTAKGIIIKIIDTGIGMSKEVGNRIFEKFYRIPTGNLHDVKGFGLGLAYVKNMVEAHGGEIKVQSELKKGSEFTVYLPYEFEN